MKTSKIISIIYYILLIFIMIWIISGMVDWKKYISNGNDPGDIDELEETTEKRKKKKKFEYDQNILQINLKPGENKIDNTRTIDF